MPTQSRAQAAAALRQIAFGLRASQALYVAAKLNVADLLAEKPMNADELSSVTHADSTALRRVTRALCSLDVFAESGTGEFSLNSTGANLSQSGGSFRKSCFMKTLQKVRHRYWSIRYRLLDPSNRYIRLQLAKRFQRGLRFLNLSS